MCDMSCLISLARSWCDSCSLEDLQRLQALRDVSSTPSSPDVVLAWAWWQGYYTGPVYEETLQLLQTMLVKQRDVSWCLSFHMRLQRLFPWSQHKLFLDISALYLQAYLEQPMSVLHDLLLCSATALYAAQRVFKYEGLPLPVMLKDIAVRYKPSNFSGMQSSIIIQKRSFPLLHTHEQHMYEHLFQTRRLILQKHNMVPSLPLTTTKSTSEEEDKSLPSSKKEH